MKENCSMCWRPATRKVGEEGGASFPHPNATNYLCEPHFQRVMFGQPPLWNRLRAALRAAWAEVSAVRMYRNIALIEAAIGALTGDERAWYLAFFCVLMAVAVSARVTTVNVTNTADTISGEKLNELIWQAVEKREKDRVLKLGGSPFNSKQEASAAKTGFGNL